MDKEEENKIVILCMCFKMRLLFEWNLDSALLTLDAAF